MQPFYNPATPPSNLFSLSLPLPSPSFPPSPDLSPPPRTPPPPSPSSPSSSSSSTPSNLSPLNYFVHNGYRYDGDLFQLRPPQERTTASRPERILEHKPPLLHNRQVFNRVYSEGTYNNRPNSLRKPNRNSARFSASSFGSEPEDDACGTQQPLNLNSIQLDGPAYANIPPVPVLRPGSVRPSAGLSPGGFVKKVEAVRNRATEFGGYENLKGVLACSGVPVEKVTGRRPDLLSSSGGNVIGRKSTMGNRAMSGVRPVGGVENVRPKEKRGKSYAGGGTTGFVGKQKRPSFWMGRLLSR